MRPATLMRAGEEGNGRCGREREEDKGGQRKGGRRKEANKNGNGEDGKGKVCENGDTKRVKMSRSMPMDGLASIPSSRAPFIPTDDALLQSLHPLLLLLECRC